MFVVEQLQRLHTKRLMVRFDGTEVQDEQDIDLATQSITAMFRQAEKTLKRMATGAQVHEAGVDAKIRENVQRFVRHRWYPRTDLRASRGLPTKLQSLSVEFRKSQKDYLSRVKKQKQGSSEFDFLSQNNDRAGGTTDPVCKPSTLVGVSPGLRRIGVFQISVN